MIDKLLAAVFIAACLSFGLGVVLTLVLTMRASAQARGNFLHRLKVDATWPVSVLRDKAWSSSNDRQSARVARWSFVVAGIGIGLFLLTAYLNP